MSRSAAAAPIDSVAGALLGLTLADYFLARVGAPAIGQTAPSDPSYRPARFKGSASGVGGLDFRWDHLCDPTSGAVLFHPGAGTVADRHPSVLTWRDPVDLSGDTPSAPLHWLWKRALSEWA